MKTKLILSAVFAAYAGLAAAGQVETDIKTNVKPLLENVEIQDVVYSPRLGLYEVVTPRGLYYTDKKGSYLIFGATVVDTKTKVNLTDQRMDALSGFDIAKLPLGDAVKIVHGNGARTMVTFEDPNCPYCKKLAHELAKVDNVTVYTFLTPILSPDSTEKSKAVWCSADRANAWSGFMLNGTELPSKVDCETPIARNVALLQKLRIMGTPAIYYADNTKSPGFITADQIEVKLGAKK